MTRPEAFGPGELRALPGAVGLARVLTGERFALADDWFAWVAHRVAESLAAGRSPDETQPAERPLAPGSTLAPCSPREPG